MRQTECQIIRQIKSEYVKYRTVSVGGVSRFFLDVYLLTLSTYSFLVSTSQPTSWPILAANWLCLKMVYIPQLTIRVGKLVIDKPVDCGILRSSQTNQVFEIGTWWQAFLCWISQQDFGFRRQRRWDFTNIIHAVTLGWTRTIYIYVARMENVQVLWRNLVLDVAWILTWNLKRSNLCFNFDVCWWLVAISSRKLCISPRVFLITIHNIVYVYIWKLL